MQQVLKKLYEDHCSSIQSKRINKALDRQVYPSFVRKKYNFHDQTRLRTPETSFSMDEDIRFEKQFQETVRYRLPSLKSKFSKGKTPLITHKQRKFRLRRQLKATFLAVLFTQRLKKRIKEHFLKRRKKALKYSNNFVNFTQKLVNNYYQRVLKQELLEYVHILQKQLLNPHLNQDQQIMQMLYYTSDKLAVSSLTREIMGFFVYTCTQRGFPPSDFLSKAEIDRLYFSDKFGCLINMTQEQVRMMIALGVGVKIFCFYLWYKPWNIERAGQAIRQNKKYLTAIIKNVGSVFYFLILEQFCWNVKEVRTVSKDEIEDFGVRPIRQLDPLEEGGGGGETSRNVICGQSRQFLNKMSLKYPHLVNSIKSNLFKWVCRVSYACLKQSERKGLCKQIGMTFFKTIDSEKKDNSQEKRPMFRSIQLKRKHEEISKASNLQRYHQFPQLRGAN